MDWWFILRCFNVVGCVLGLYFQASAHYRGWKQWDGLSRYTWWSITAWLVLGLVSSLENIIMDYPPGARVLVLFIAMVYTNVALVLHRKVVPKHDSK